MWCFSDTLKQTEGKCGNFKHNHDPLKGWHVPFCIVPSFRIPSLLFFLLIIPSLSRISFLFKPSHSRSFMKAAWLASFQPPICHHFLSQLWEPPLLKLHHLVSVRGSCRAESTVCPWKDDYCFHFHYEAFSDNINITS